MRSRLGRAGRRLIIAALASLASAGLALAAGNGAYSGKTSQNQRVSFGISSGAVHNFKLVVDDRCPDGHTLVVHSSYPTMKVTSGKFGGSFAPMGAHPGEHATLSGKLGRRAVTGSVRDASYSLRERALCHGSAQFTATRA